jgi:hypothetical protein
MSISKRLSQQILEINKIITDTSLSRRASPTSRPFDALVQVRIEKE